jgi:hypothetical protein
MAPAGVPSHDEPSPGPRGRLVAGVVALVVVGAAVAFAWRFVDRTDTAATGGTTDQLPALMVSITTNGKHVDGLLRVATEVRYGGAHFDHDVTTATPPGAVVDWARAENLDPFEPGPTVGSSVEINADGANAQVLIGSVRDWPDLDAFAPIDRLPSTPGEFVLVFQADYPEGVARQVLRTRLVAPGTIQLGVTEGGKPGLATATATASVDGVLVDGFLSTSMFAESDVGGQVAPVAPDFGATAPLVIGPRAPILLTDRIGAGTAGLTETYEETPDPLPVDLTGTEPILTADPGSYLLAVEVEWRHGQLGWASDGTHEWARFFFPIEVAAVGSATEPAATG